MKDLDLNKIDSMSPEDIENLRVEDLKELKIQQEYCSLVEQDYLDLQMKIIDLQRNKKEKEIALSKAKSNIRSLKARVEILRSKFWSNRG